jgi:ATP-dependent Clp protease ATP-binding subunit ClpB
LLNRIDEVVVFRPLSRADLRSIVDLRIADVERLLAHKKLRLSLSDAAKDRLVELGYEPALGARPIRRSVLRHVQDPLAEALLRGEVPDGCTVAVDVQAEEGFALRVEQAP